VEGVLRLEADSRQWRIKAALVERKLSLDIVGFSRFLGTFFQGKLYNILSILSEETCRIDAEGTFPWHDF